MTISLRSLAPFLFVFFVGTYALYKTLFPAPTLLETHLEIDAMGTHPWAGVYTDGFFTLSAAPSGRFCLTHSFCIPPFQAGECGYLRYSNDRLTLAWHPANLGITTGSDPIPSYRFIRWDKRRYFVSEDKMIGFINDVNSGNEPRRKSDSYGTYTGFMNMEDVTLEAGGRPGLPRGYQHLLLAAPVEAVALEVGPASTPPPDMPDEDRDLFTPTMSARFDLGSSSGAFVGMPLYSLAPKGMIEGLLDVVHESSSTGRISVKYRDGDTPLPVSGHRFSSRKWWR